MNNGNLMLLICGIALIISGVIFECFYNKKIKEIERTSRFKENSNLCYGCAIGDSTVLHNTTGNNNIILGKPGQKTLFVVDSVLFCQKCNKNHHAYFSAQSLKTMIYKAKCGTEFNVEPRHANF